MDKYFSLPIEEFRSMTGRFNPAMSTSISGCAWPSRRA